MKLRFWIGIIFIAFAAGLFAYRGEIVALVTERWEKRGIPEEVAYNEVVDARPNTAVYPSDDGALAPHPTLSRGARGITEMPLPRGEGELSALPRLQAEEDLPVEFNLAVPFTSQAPFAVWDEIHDDACEEASVMMVDAFFGGRNFAPQSADEEIYRLVDWQTQNLGHWKDTNAEVTARILREHYGYEKVRIVENPTLEMIKREIFAGRPVIVPAAGQLLGNPYFRGAGPPYHMLVVRGWTKDGRIITNDPGTKRGNSFLYSPEVLLNAIHDWTGSDATIKQGRKAVIVVEP